MTSRTAGVAGAGPVDAVLAASRALAGVAASSISVLDDEVTLPQFRALVLVSDGLGDRTGDLAVALGVHPSNATRVVDRMVAKGLLERMPAQDNRRAVTLTLGPEGRSALRWVTARRQSDIEAVLGAMAPERAAVGRRCARRLRGRCRRSGRRGVEARLGHLTPRAWAGLAPCGAGPVSRAPEHLVHLGADAAAARCNEDRAARWRYLGREPHQLTAGVVGIGLEATRPASSARRASSSAEWGFSCRTSARSLDGRTLGLRPSSDGEHLLVLGRARAGARGRRPRRSGGRPAGRGGTGRSDR